MTFYEYIHQQVTRKRGRGKPPVFLKILKPHVDELEAMSDNIYGVIYRYVNWGTQDGKQQLLSTISTKVGRTVAGFLDVELTKYEEVKVGVFFVEAAVNTDLVKLQVSHMDHSKFGFTKCYELVPGSSFELTILTKPTATVPNKIFQINQLRQACKRSVMKRWGKDRAEEFKSLLSCDEDPNRPEAFIMAANNLQQTAWKVNYEALEIITRYHWDKFEYEVDPDDEPEASKVRDNIVVLNKAIHFSEWEKFYQYVSFDWRGRVYYDEPYFNFQGSDLARGLMSFYEAKPLGDSGLFWLKIHTANSFNMSYDIDSIPEWCEQDYKSMLEEQGLFDISVDKMSLRDRAKWTEENMSNILLTAYMGGLPDCEKPVSYLAACLEWKKIDSWFGTPETFPSSLPVGVDGSNNGWQHLGAMLRDGHTGSLVGLMDLPIPKDLYVTVAQRLTELLPEYFEKHPMPMKAIRKGIAKRGTMTKAYSAGATTMAENMWNDIKQYGFDEKYGIAEEDTMLLAHGLVEAISDTCPLPMRAMKVLQDIAEAKVNFKGDTVSWQSPSGFPVEQQYWLKDEDEHRVQIEPPDGQKYHFEPVGQTVKDKDGLILGYNGKIKLVMQEFNDCPNKRDHASSISPNFVHSQDAAHLSLVVANWDGPFGAVHDSFSCHAGDVEELVALTKATFVELYEDENFFETLCADLEVEVELPSPGSLDIEEVLKSDFFFA